MDSSKIIGWAAVAAAAWYGVLRGARALFIGVTGFRFTGLSLVENTATFVLNFVIQNPLFVGIKLDKVVGDVYIQGIKCGRVDNVYQYYMTGGKAHNIPVAVTIDLSQLTHAAVENIMSGDVNTLTVSFDGSVTVGDNGLVAIPIQKTIGLSELV